MIAYSQKDLTAIAVYMAVEELRNLGCFKDVEQCDFEVLVERKCGTGAPNSPLLENGNRDNK